MIVIADRRAADGEDDVVTSRQLLERAGEFHAVVGKVAGLDGGGDLSGEHRGEHDAIAVGDLAGGERASGRDEIVAGGDDPDARAAAQGKPPRADWNSPL